MKARECGFGLIACKCTGKCRIILNSQGKSTAPARERGVIPFDRITKLHGTRSFQMKRG